MSHRGETRVGEREEAQGGGRGQAVERARTECRRVVVEGEPNQPRREGAHLAHLGGGPGSGPGTGLYFQHLFLSFFLLGETSLGPRGERRQANLV